MTADDMDGASPADPTPATHNVFSGGAAEHLIQANIVHLGFGSAAPRSLGRLPPRLPGLLGRAAPQARLRGLLAPDRDGDAPLAVAVTGEGGVGKSALAVAAAHAAEAEGWFPGGVLYADAGAHSGREPVGVEELLGTWLRSFGIPGDQLQPHRDGLLAQFRSTLRDQRGAVLILLDDASADRHLAPLIPADDRHRLLVTVRMVPADPRVAVVPLAPLAPEDSRALLADRATGAAQRPELDEIAALCEHLPLALEVMAGRLRAERDGARRILDALRPDGERLTELDPVRQAFDASYRALDEPDARLLRFLGLHPGSVIDAGSAAALAGVSAAEADRTLRRLVRAHLLQPTGSEGRARFHDLLRLYARELAGREPAAERTAALGRLLAHYGERAAGAGDAWFEGERGTLAAAVAEAVEQGLYDLVEPVAVPLGAYLIRRTLTVDALTVLRQAVLAAQHRGDHRREAELLLTMRRQYRALGRRREARECAEAGHLARIRLGVRSPEVDDEFGEQAAERGDHEAARYHLQRAAQAWRRRSDTRRLAASLSALGQALEALGHFEEATGAYSGAAARADAAGDLVVAAHASLLLAGCAAHGHQRDFDVMQLRQVLEVAREAGDLRATIEALELLAVAEIRAGRTPAAAPLLKEAIGLAESHRLPLLLNRLLTVELERLQLEAKEAEAAALQARVERLPTPTPPEVPEPPVRLAARHVRPVLLRLFAFPVCGALWALGQLLWALVQGGPMVLWLGQLLVAAGMALGARQRWLPSHRPLLAFDVRVVRPTAVARRVYITEAWIDALGTPVAGAGQLAAGASAGALRDSLVAAALLVLHGAAQLWPRLRERLKSRS
ncbi:NB-ARC domain-containing protein [Streptomyces celluloflavus]|uniref:NB-ARC domain-containing protein n=1 Tax=Streptomyces celluloflavus TaxID=58344 RepID=UPI003665711E